MIGNMIGIQASQASQRLTAIESSLVALSLGYLPASASVWELDVATLDAVYMQRAE
jgi:hypothetical protein